MSKQNILPTPPSQEKETHPDTEHVATVNPPKPQPLSVKNPPKVVEVVGISLFIVVSTIIAVWLFANVFQRIESYRLKTEVKWENKADYQLDAGPAWFLYRQNEDVLVAIQAVDDAAKETLLKLYDQDSVGYPAYQNAIEELAFETQNAPKPSYLLTLLIGGIAAVIGVQIRTIHRFLLRACYAYDLNIKIWWPWYVMRPVVGFLLGCAVILLAQVNLITIAHEDSSVFFWIGLSILAGFGTPDVVDRLHKVSETLFATSNNNSHSANQGNNVDPNPEHGGGK